MTRIAKNADPAVDPAVLNLDGDGAAVPAAEPATGAADFANPDVRGYKRAWITIPKSSDPLAVKEPTLSINGQTIQLQRGVKVAVPLPYLEQLQNTLQTNFYHDGHELLSLDVPALPYQFHGFADD
ncbi:hypothetical protein SAMN02745857_02758 [Andreprevotia lacus DSM 23236]|uniref:Uncharacterized protein n=1 Tax=Andreprevotia lacus DSM 23236 TaxID=1121001 RepID=A0A1W1XTN2_9NEIS|nr:hypothetical protein [Andreprevotia lacus]SMC27224.1 hypothetical protein SAMN02745857_02758 [Andreprevotia lacus DSM 23236]